MDLADPERAEAAGRLGVAGFAAVDAAFLGMPLDAIVAGYSYANPRKLLLYAVMAAAGSALGSILIYWIGYKGGEVLLVKRIGKSASTRSRPRSSGMSSGW